MTETRAKTTDTAPASPQSFGIVPIISSSVPLLFVIAWSSLFESIVAGWCGRDAFGQVSKNYSAFDGRIFPEGFDDMSTNPRWVYAHLILLYRSSQA